MLQLTVELYEWMALKSEYGNLDFSYNLVLEISKSLISYLISVKTGT